MYVVSLLLGALFAGGLIVESLVMSISDPRDGFTLSHPHTHDGFFLSLKQDLIY